MESLKACAASLLLRGRSVALLASELGPQSRSSLSPEGQHTTAVGLHPARTARLSKS